MFDDHSARMVFDHPICNKDAREHDINNTSISDTFIENAVKFVDGPISDVYQDVDNEDTLTFEPDPESFNSISYYYNYLNFFHSMKTDTSTCTILKIHSRKSIQKGSHSTPLHNLIICQWR